MDRFRVMSQIDSGYTSMARSSRRTHDYRSGDMVVSLSEMRSSDASHLDKNDHRASLETAEGGSG